MTVLSPTQPEPRQQDVQITTANLHLTRLIGHQILVARSAGQQNSALLSNNLLKSNTDVESTLQKRTVLAIAKRSKTFNMHFVRSGPGTFFPLGMDAVQAADDAAFAAASQSIAELLAESHRRGLEDGLLVIAQAKVGTRPALVLVKADRQDGISSERDSSNNNVLQLLNNLFLTAGSKLHKVLIMVQVDDELEPSAFHSILFDGSLRKATDLMATQYFIDDFLGAEIMSEGRRETYKFYQAAVEAISSTAEDSAQQYDLLRRLDAYMTGPKDLFTVEDFITDVIPEALQEGVESKLAKTAPDRAIVRDTQDIKQRLKQTTLLMPNGVRVIVPNDLPDESVQVSAAGNRTIVSVDIPPSDET